MREGAVRRLRAWALSAGLTACVLAAPSANAHLMADGQGTVNVHNGKAFVVLSLPIRWLGLVDDDHDDHLSPAELSLHRARILMVLERALHLENGGRSGPLQDVLLLPSPAHARGDGAGTHLVVMGARALNKPSEAVRLRLDFAGPAQDLEIMGTRGAQKTLTSVKGPKARVQLLVSGG